MTADTTNYVWRPPTEMPDLRQVGVIALDTETKDEGLAAERGSAWPWGGGYVCGASVAYREGENIRALYFPLRHPDSTNFNATQVFQWLRDMIASDVRIVGQNTLYDFGWLRAEAGIKMPPSERLEEIGALATLVDENRYSYALDELCKWRGLPGKNEMLLREGIETLGLVTNKRKKVTPQIISGNCRRVMLDHTPKPMRPVRWRCSRASTQSSIKRGRATPTGSKSICCPWCWRCAGAASASM